MYDAEILVALLPILFESKREQEEATLTKEKENKKEPIRHVYHYQFEKKPVEEVRMDRVKDLHPLKTEYIKVGSEYYSTTPCIDFEKWLSGK